MVHSKGLRDRYLFYDFTLSDVVIIIDVIRLSVSSSETLRHEVFIIENYLSVFFSTPRDSRQTKHI
ncbi:hypothetical protein [Aestuariivivens sediminicola]|uniref:hypothetical protein n=1 Tax=Aestuariivivens sediminicola TaxID=2913560 RepID=UPI001F5649D2|nr:hypothetical protein [Aestuariivivens sediminicola]